MRRRFLLLLPVLLLAGCGGASNLGMNLISMKDGKATYAVRGLVMVPEMYEGVTKPYAERDLSAACPAGVTFKEYNEYLNKHVVTGQDWVEWVAVAECK